MPVAALITKRIPSNSHVEFDGISLSNFSFCYKFLFRFISIYIDENYEEERRNIFPQDNQSIILIDKIDHYFDHDILFLGTAFCNHQGQSYQGVVRNTLATVLTIEDAVLLHKPEE